MGGENTHSGTIVTRGVPMIAWAVRTGVPHLPDPAVLTRGRPDSQKSVDFIVHPRPHLFYSENKDPSDFIPPRSKRPMPSQIVHQPGFRPGTFTHLFRYFQRPFSPTLSLHL